MKRKCADSQFIVTVSDANSKLSDTSKSSHRRCSIEKAKIWQYSRESNCVGVPF